jgi:hypothetical protein
MKVASKDAFAEDGGGVNGLGVGTLGNVVAVGRELGNEKEDTVGKISVGLSVEVVGVDLSVEVVANVVVVVGVRVGGGLITVDVRVEGGGLLVTVRVPVVPGGADPLQIKPISQHPILPSSPTAQYSVGRQQPPSAQQ